MMLCVWMRPGRTQSLASLAAPSIKEYATMKCMTLVLVSIIAGCTATAEKPPRGAASSVGAPPAALEKYETFTFGAANPPAAGYDTTARSLAVQRRLTPLVRASLEKRGYKQTTDGPDLVIKISTGSGTLTADARSWDGPSEQSATGFIGIDAYDRVTGTDVWHGSAFAEVDPERIDDRLLARGVEHMLADFPVRRR
jgi:hypothetical protein